LLTATLHLLLSASPFSRLLVCLFFKFNNFNFFIYFIY